MRVLGPVFRVVIAAIIGGIITGVAFTSLWLLLEPRMPTNWGSLVLSGIRFCDVGAIVGALAGATNVIVQALRPREPVSWD